MFKNVPTVGRTNSVAIFVKVSSLHRCLFAIISNCILQEHFLNYKNFKNLSKLGIKENVQVINSSKILVITETF